MCVQNLKLVALPIREIIRSTQKIWAVPTPWIRPSSLFSQIFNGLLFGWTLWIYRPNLQSVSEILAIAVWGWDCEPPVFGEEEAVGGRGWYRSKGRWWVPIGRVRLSEILPLLRSTFPHPKNKESHTVEVNWLSECTVLIKIDKNVAKIIEWHLKKLT